MIYLDHHAATPIVPLARQAMERALALHAASPSSTHAAGRAARAELERARDAVAAALGGAPADVIFTSGGTEAIALAIAGVGRGGRSIVTSTLEHPAVARAIDRREVAGAKVLRVHPRDILGAIDHDTDLVAIQHANHETGAIVPLTDIALTCRRFDVPLVVDACQSFGKIRIDVRALGAAAVAVAASKIGGPAGAGALWTRRELALEPTLVGGAQERGRRAGAPGLIALAGFGGAAACLDVRLDSMAAIAARRDRLEEGVIALGAISNAPAGQRLATVASVAVRAFRGAALVAALDLEGLSASSGAACSSGLDAPSPVLLASFPDEPWRASSALRLTLGPETSDEDIDEALRIVKRVLARR